MSWGTACMQYMQVEAGSYHNIALSLGVDAAEQICFATDNIKEAEAASQAGWQVALAVRPDNEALPAQHPFRVVTSMSQLLSP